MTTQIQALPQLVVSFAVGTNEDWSDSLAFVNADASPISLAGISFDMMVRQTAATPAVLLTASSSVLIDGQPPSGTLSAGGVGGNVLSISIPVAKTQRIPIFSNPCVYDIVARGDGIARRFITGTVVFEQGVTR